MILETIETKHNGLFPPLWQISAPFQRCEKEVVSKSMILLGVAVQHDNAALHNGPRRWGRLPTPRLGLTPNAHAHARDGEGG